MSLEFGKQYGVAAWWGPRAETPSAVAGRFSKMIDAIRDVDPLLRDWRLEGRGDFEAVRPQLVQYVAAKVSRDDLGEVWEEEGYGFFAYQSRKEKTYSIKVTAGSVYPDIPSWNKIFLETNTNGSPPPEMITYRIFKAALLAMVDAWTPQLCFAYPSELLELAGRKGAFFSSYWMLYLDPHFAPFVTPPTSAVNERLADGGLLMSATTETFRIDNPQHMAVGRDIGAAVAHLAEK